LLSRPGDEVPASVGRRDSAHLDLRIEWGFVILLALLSIPIVTWLSRDLWFYADVWEYLTNREIGSVDDLLRPHGGHWATPSVIQTRILYGTVGMDFWPGHLIPRLIEWAGLSVFCWTVIRRQGADPVISIGIYATLLVLGTSWLVQSAFVGNLLASASLIGVALIVDTDRDPGLGKQLGAFALFMLGLISNAIGVAAFGGAAVALLLLRRIRPWLPSIGAATVIYATWWILYDVSTERGIELTFDRIFGMPRGIVTALQGAMANFLGLPNGFGPIALIALVTWLGWLASRGRLSTFDAVLLAAVVVYLGLAAMTRPGVIDHDRYAIPVTMWLILVAVPPIRLPQIRGSRFIAGILLLAIAVSNLGYLKTETGHRAAVINADRPKVEAAATLIAAGEPYLGEASMGLGNALTAEGIARLVNDGWNPMSTTSLNDARGAMRIVLHNSPLLRTDASVVVNAGVDSDGCAGGSAAEPVTFHSVGTGVVRVDTSVRTVTRILWDDEYGTARLRRDIRGSTYLHFAAPLSGATITLTPADASAAIRLCDIP
jgi:hypothetical protein